MWSPRRRREPSRTPPPRPRSWSRRRPGQRPSTLPPAIRACRSPWWRSALRHLPRRLRDLGQPPGPQHRQLGQHQRKAAAERRDPQSARDIHVERTVRQRRRRAGIRSRHAAAAGATRRAGRRRVAAAGTPARRKGPRNLAVPGALGRREQGRHEAFLKIINGGGNAVSTEGGEVTLQLGALLTQVGAKLGVGGNLAEKLPPDAGELAILKSEQLSAAQEIAKLVSHLPVFLTLLAIILFGLAIYLAGPRRRESVRGVGIAFVAAGLLALIVRGIAGGYVVSALSASASVEPAAEAVWSIGTSLLVTVATSAVAFGIILILGAWLAGPTKSATTLRRLAAPHVREDPVPAYAVAALVFLALILWAPIAAFRQAARDPALRAALRGRRRSPAAPGAGRVPG